MKTYTGTEISYFSNWQNEDVDNPFNYSSTQVVLWGFSCVYMAGTFVILIWPLWALSNQPNSSSLMHPTFMYKGIWLECGSTLSGDYLCDNYVEPLFNLPRNLMKMRAVGIMAGLCAALACAITLASNEFIRLFDFYPNLKRFIYKIGILFQLVSGILLTWMSVFFAAQIRREFKWTDDQLDRFIVNSDHIRYEYGGCVYAAFVLSFLNYFLVLFMICAQVPGHRCLNICGDLDNLENAENAEMNSLEKNIKEQIINDENEIHRLEMEERKSGFTEYTTPLLSTGGKPKRRNSRVTMATEATVFEYDDTVYDRGTRENDPGYFI